MHTEVRGQNPGKYTLNCLGPTLCSIQNYKCRVIQGVHTSTPKCVTSQMVVHTSTLNCLTQEETYIIIKNPGSTKQTGTGPTHPSVV